MKKVLITGSNGFVGQNLIAFLKDNFELYGFDRNKTSNLPESNYFVGDLGDFHLLENIFESIKPDVLIHLAAIVHKNNADTSEKNYNFINYDCSKKLFDLSAKYGTYVVFSSTIEVYGENDLKVIDENTPCHPDSFYAKSKYKAEEYLKTINVEYSILRFTPLYGKDFTLNVDKRVFLKKNKIAYYFKDGSYTFDFCSINNVCEFIKGLIEEDRFKNNVYVLADEKIMSTKDIIDMHKKYTKIHLILKLPYHLTGFCISMIEELISLFKKKDIYLSRRNFDKLFASKEYCDSKIKKGTFKWNMESTIYGEKYE